MYRLYVFSDSNGENEFVVISSEPIKQVLSEHNQTPDEIMHIDGDFSMYPCDRPLVDRS